MSLFKREIIKEEKDVLAEHNSQLIQQLNDTLGDEISKENYLEYDDDDPATADISAGDLTIDGSWHELDLDSYKTVPDDAIGFWARVLIKETGGARAAIGFRATSQSNGYQSAGTYTVGLTEFHGTVLPIPLDSNHKFDYYVDAIVDSVIIVVLWWIRSHT